MKRIFILAGSLAVLFIAVNKVYGQKTDVRPSDIKQKKTIYFTPEVYPNIDEIKEPTNLAFFDAVSDKIKDEHGNRLIRVDMPSEYDKIDAKTIEEYCKNNEADFAVVPKVKFFKVGLGKYIFSNQVIVSMKLYDAKGNLITESDYDTYKKNKKLLGSAENFIKTGTEGAMKNLLKKLRKMRRNQEDNF